MAKNKKSARLMKSETKEAVYTKWMELRKSGLSVYDAAKIVGVTYQTLHKWEMAHTGTVQPTGRPPKKTQKEFIMGRGPSGESVVTTVETPVPDAQEASAAAQPVAAKPKLAKPVEAQEKLKKAPICPPASTDIVVTTPNGFTILCPDVETARKLIA